MKTKPARAAGAAVAVTGSTAGQAATLLSWPVPIIGEGDDGAAIEHRAASTTQPMRSKLHALDRLTSRDGGRRAWTRSPELEGSKKSVVSLPFPFIIAHPEALVLGLSLFPVLRSIIFPMVVSLADYCLALLGSSLLIPCFIRRRSHAWTYHACHRAALVEYGW